MAAKPINLSAGQSNAARFPPRRGEPSCQVLLLNSSAMYSTGAAALPSDHGRGVDLLLLLLTVEKATRG
jgi:hypothetical protein